MSPQQRTPVVLDAELPGDRENLLLLLTQHPPDRVWQRVSRLRVSRLRVPSTVKMLVPESRGRSRQEGPGPGHVPRSGARGRDCDGRPPASLGYHRGCSCCAGTGAALPRCPGPPGRGEQPLPGQTPPWRRVGTRLGVPPAPPEPSHRPWAGSRGRSAGMAEEGATSPPQPPAPFHCTCPGTPDPRWTRPGGASAPAPLGSGAL